MANLCDIVSKGVNCANIYLMVAPLHIVYLTCKCAMLRVLGYVSNSQKPREIECMSKSCSYHKRNQACLNYSFEYIYWLHIITDVPNWNYMY